MEERAVSFCLPACCWDLLPMERPVLLWALPSWRGPVNYWWLLDSLHRTGRDLTSFWVAEPTLPDPHNSDHWFHPPSLAELHPDRFALALQNLPPLRTAELRAGVRLWRAFANDSPLPLDLARRQGSPQMPELGHIAVVPYESCRLSGAVFALSKAG